MCFAYFSFFSVWRRKTGDGHPQTTGRKGGGRGGVLHRRGGGGGGNRNEEKGVGAAIGGWKGGIGCSLETHLATAVSTCLGCSGEITLFEFQGIARVHIYLFSLPTFEVGVVFCFCF